MQLHAERGGSGSRLVLVHGFTQTGRCWGELVPALEAGHEVVRVDAPGHGRSGDVVANLPTGADLIASVGAEATYLGYSMGARFCLHVALAHPELVHGLVLVSGTAGLDTEGDRAARRAQDAETAARIEALGVAAFVDQWLAQPLFASLGPERSFRSERLENTVAGLQSSLREAGTGTQEPSWDRLHKLEMPVLVVAGEEDAKFVALGERLAAAVGANATFAPIPGAGHTTHLERPLAFRDLLRTWLHAHRL
jgi:2-succinyl-6-hydroxy-2,4-cyclohexadiene-1-carboxylate synthase